MSPSSSPVQTRAGVSEGELEPPGAEAPGVEPPGVEPPEVPVAGFGSAVTTGEAELAVKLFENRCARMRRRNRALVWSGRYGRSVSGTTTLIMREVASVFLA